MNGSVRSAGSPTAMTPAQFVDISNIRRVRAKAPAEAVEMNDSGLAPTEDPASPTSVDQRSQSTLEQHQEVMGDIQRDISTFFAQSFVSTYVTAWAKAFVACVVVATIVAIAVCSALLAEVYASNNQMRVTDDSVCGSFPVLDFKTNTLAYNCALIITAFAFAAWHAGRSIGLEKSASVVCFIIADLMAVGRTLYMVYGNLIPQYPVRSSTMTATAVLLTMASLLLFGALFPAYMAYRAFGWRMYIKGATTAEQVRALNRFQLMGTFVKLDVMTSVNTFVSIIFAVSVVWVQALSLIVVALTIAMLLLLSYFIKRQVAWFVYAFTVLCTIMPALYIYLIVLVLGVSDASCYEDNLVPCLVRGNVTIAPMNTSDTATAAHAFAGPSGSASGLWFVLPADCPIGSPCGNTSSAAVAMCCDGYGRCDLKRQFVKTDQGLMISLAVIGVAVRVMTIVTSFKRIREIDVPSIQELFQRGERNLREFAQPFVRTAGSPTATTPPSDTLQD